MSQIVLHVNSLIDRQPSDESTSSWTTHLSYPIRPNGRRVALTLENIELPNTAYSFPVHSSMIWWERGGSLYSVQINTNRFFVDATSLVAHLNSAFASVGAGLSVAYDTVTARLTFQNNLGIPCRIVGSYRFSDRLADTYNSAVDRLGLIQDTRNTEIPAGGLLVCQGILRLLRTSCYYLTCNLLDTRVRQSIVPSPYYAPLVLGRITASNFGQLSQLAFAQTFSFDCGTRDINAIEFTLLDDELQPCDLLGSPITLSMRITIT